MKIRFAGRQFGREGVSGYQLRVLPELAEWPQEFPRQQCLLNPAATRVLSSCPLIWPSALADDDLEDLTDPVTGLLDWKAVLLGLSACEPQRSAVVYASVQPRGSPCAATPVGFEYLGIDVTNSWQGLSIISSQPFQPDEWAHLRSLGAGALNDWNLLTDMERAWEIAELGDRLVPEHGPYSPVSYAYCRAEFCSGRESEG